MIASVSRESVTNASTVNHRRQLSNRRGWMLSRRSDATARGGGAGGEAQ